MSFIHEATRPERAHTRLSGEISIDMNLYEVIFYGADGRNDDADTIYLVRASDFRSAVETVCHSLSAKYHALHESPITPDAVFEIGKDLSASQDTVPLPLRGPYVQCAYNYGWRTWERKIKEGVKTDDWEEKP